MKRLISLFFLLSLGVVSLNAQSVDYSVVAVEEERGTDFMQITSSNDYVCMPIVIRKGNSKDISWLTNRIIDVTPDGKSIAYLSSRNESTNIFVKELDKQGGSTQRTNRKAILDFTYSPDGKYLVFSENRGTSHQIFLTDANEGYICRQITSASQDYSPIYNKDMSKIFFARLENNNVSIWSYDVKSNFVSSYSSGMNPYPTDNNEVYLCTRMSSNGHSEIWRVNVRTGVEECLVSDAQRSFTTPVLSPDGQWVLFVGVSDIVTPNFVYKNTDIYACRIDGTSMVQLTYHAADDLSPVWSCDGKYVYFVSQRGSVTATANIWRMPFVY